MKTSLKDRQLGVSLALALSATSCTTYVVESRPVPPVEVYVPAPTVYYYEPSTVYFVANYFDWPASRVEFYFARGWTCHDLLIGFEFSARTRTPWREVVHHYERHTTVYRETHHIQEVHRTTTVEERHFVWSHVAQEIGVTSESAELQASIASPAAYAELEEDLAARAVAQEYSVRAADVDRLLDKGYDVGELAAAYDRVEQDRDTAAVEEALAERHQEWEALEERVASAQTAGLEEAVQDSQAPDWTEAQEEAVAGEAAGPAASADLEKSRKRRPE